MDVEIHDISAFGLIQDTPAYRLPPEAWSYARNVRARDGRFERMGGKTQVWTPSVAPYFNFYVVSPAGVPWWLYMSLTKAYAFDFTTHSDITRAAGDYTAGIANDWCGTVFSGFPIFTSGSDAVQYWSAFSGATDLILLPNWNANWTCKTIRAFGNYLVAFNITKTGTAYPYMVKWSHAADPGAVPASWDETDETKDAGETDLVESKDNGPILDAMQLGNTMYIYKEGSTWQMHRVGGRYIFDFDTFLTGTGLIAKRCVALCDRGRRHFAFTGDDMIVHDGNNVRSLLPKRMRRTIFNRIDPTNRGRCFVFENPAMQEVWACYPETGQTNPNLALVWNYGEGGEDGVFYEADVDFVTAAEGFMVDDDITWDSETSQLWDHDDAPWDVGRQRVVVVGRGAGATKTLQLDDGLTNDGSTFVATLQRTGLALDGRTRDGRWITNWRSRKLVTRVWITMEGGPISVRVGTQLAPEGNVTWSDSQTFNPASAQYVDVALEGPAIAVEFSSTASVDWSLLSYTIEEFLISRFGSVT